MLDREGSRLFGEEHRTFRAMVRKFIECEFSPQIEAFEEAGKVARDFWLKCGEAGLLCPTMPEIYGGLGLDFTFNAIINEEFTYAMMADSITLQTDITMPYILHYGSEAQKAELLPRMLSGETIVAIAMTEPGAGSDLQGVRTTARLEGADYVINGAKTFITNGQNADVIITVCKTAPAAGAKGTSLILVEADRPGLGPLKPITTAGLVPIVLGLSWMAFKRGRSETRSPILQD